MAQQGEAVRKLKEDQGLSNSAAEVKDEVAQLLKLKETASRLQDALSRGGSLWEDSEEAPPPEEGIEYEREAIE